MEPIIVNLDEPRLARYIRASIVLAVKGDNYKAVSELVDRKKPELKSGVRCTWPDARWRMSEAPRTSIASAARFARRSTSNSGRAAGP